MAKTQDEINELLASDLFQKASKTNISLSMREIQ